MVTQVEFVSGGNVCRGNETSAKNGYLDDKYGEKREN